MENLQLQKTANEIRKGIVTAVHSAKSGHPGGSLSAADIFTYLYFEEMNVDPKNPKDPDRDRFVLSKGHVAPGLYATLANRGFFPVEDLITLRHVGSYLQGHPDMKHIPGVDMSSGSLGQGFSAAVGMAAAGKMDKKDYRVYALAGDGEIEEIADKMLQNLNQRLSGLNITLKCEDSVKSALAKIGFDDAYGARPLRREIQNKIEDPLSEKILDSTVKKGDTVICKFADGNFVFETE